ncbi:PQQ-binding-like beta-propeller repeat protein [Haloglomus litoreum]|uniref:outer membrane protein assembly factor BamB family protein n=1 Tax=Haloglomus litoreum TaxID=3034026 RepID=UPI0023E86DCD|nr:PQQ-binding-like beta-propeller repeat protein [Haloglomus sp. DT116]
MAPSLGGALVGRALPALALVACLLLAGCALPGGTDGGDDGDLTASVDWVAGDSEILGNHHSPGVGRLPDTDGPDGVVVAHPLGGRGDRAGCRLLALNGSGGERWTEPVPPEHCTIHAVADPTVADFLGGPAPEVIASTTEAETVAYDARTGQRRFAVSLTDYGYVTPVVANLTGDDAPELVTLDARGELFVVRPDGVVWRRSLDAYTFADPSVDDFDADGAPELVLGLGDGRVLALTGNGVREWNTSLSEAVVWAEAADVDEDAAVEFLVTTFDGEVLALDGRTGEVEWRYGGAGDLAAVGPALDGDGDGGHEVYVTGKDARVRALDGGTGEVEWTSEPLSEAPLRSVPPAVAGDVDGDGTDEIVAVTGDGVVGVLAGDGTVRATYDRGGDRALYTPAVTADLDDDGRDEVLVPYGDGRLHAVSFD